jgi:hypothetical protein
MLSRMDGHSETAAYRRVPDHAPPDNGMSDKERRTGKYRPTTGSGHAARLPTGMCQATSGSGFALTKRNR